jgi:PEP-CTERM motif
MDRNGPIRSQPATQDHRSVVHRTVNYSRLRCRGGLHLKRTDTWAAIQINNLPRWHKTCIETGAPSTPQENPMSSFRIRSLALAATTLLSLGAQADSVSITFDVAQAGYVPGAQGVPQDISNQFASLGLLLTDVEHGTAASIGDCTGGVGSDPHHLYGARGRGDQFGSCGDTTPNLDFLFVNPADSMQAAYTTAFSLLVTDGSDTVMTAYDMFGAVLGSISTGNNGFNQRIGLSGIGQIARINVRTASDYTAYDDLEYEEVQAFGAVPEPASFALAGLALLALARSRKTAAAR